MTDKLVYNYPQDTGCLTDRQKLIHFAMLLRTAHPYAAIVEWARPDPLSQRYWWEPVSVTDMHGASIPVNLNHIPTATDLDGRFVTHIEEIPGVWVDGQGRQMINTLSGAVGSYGSLAVPHGQPGTVTKRLSHYGSVTTTVNHLLSLKWTEQPVVIIGLGNPTEHYTDTPHNVGWDALGLLHDTLHGAHNDWIVDREWPLAAWSRCATPTRETLLIRPLTFMNDSGLVLHRLAEQYPIGTDVVILMDNTDMAFGKIRVKRNTSPNGHHGLESILGHYPTGWTPPTVIRAGVGGPRQHDLTRDYVLAKWADQAAADRLIRHLALVAGAYEARGFDGACQTAALLNPSK